MKQKHLAESEHKDRGRTYATLCIYHNSADPKEVTKVLSLQPDRFQKAGHIVSSKRKAVVSGWFWGTKDVCSSNNLQVHLNLIVRKLISKKKELQELNRSGYDMSIFCYWESVRGNGGPILSHKLIEDLAEIPVDLFFDIWFTPPHRSEAEKSFENQA